ncbi:hypothetical protein J1G44_07610 [Cellulomonas sp. zg-ZUI199]|uniref:Uncharacterized protein n=1 Tax=Cellulomonas wangleii TaxID=2816956 RepID=A0ABX8D9B5_9CELL|nr:hypothetical protein [Cellulomonas wangleii]MBO0924350.1 hypothetical protein [Cellulomonas wangleii]QVI62352.1 hypothetical protein KG103_18455 [Cellulomonas wangleii]
MMPALVARPLLLFGTLRCSRQLEAEGIEAQPIDVAVDGRPPTLATLYHGSVDESVREYLRLVFRRRIDGRHRWWAGEWWRDRADPHMAA